MFSRSNGICPKIDTHTYQLEDGRSSARGPSPVDKKKRSRIKSPVVVQARTKRGQGYEIFSNEALVVGNVQSAMAFVAAILEPGALNSPNLP